MLFCISTMTFRYTSRKRPRSNEELDFMPISKKMSDLHIRSNHNSHGLENNWHHLSAVQGRTSLLADVICHCTEKKISSEIMDCNCHSAVEPQENGFCHSASVALDNIYAPELNSTQNPYYYHINSILYEAHTLRLQRLLKADNNNKTN